MAPQGGLLYYHDLAVIEDEDVNLFNDYYGHDDNLQLLVRNDSTITHTTVTTSPPKALSAMDEC